jgi:hypothetical protein
MTQHSPNSMRGRAAGRSRGRTGRPLALALALALLPACEGVPLMSPDGSTAILLQANPSFVAANGGRSVVTAVLTEPAATFVPDGTVVFFFTNLGQIDASAVTVNGLARVYFVADARSGQACVTAYSGGAAPAGTCTSSGSGGTTTTTSGATASGKGNASVTISVGSKLPKNAIVTADPPRITNPRHAAIVANVYDESGNPVQNVPVVFTITAFGIVLDETLDSGGAPRYTDSNGQAFDVLRTRAATTDAQRAVTVTATIPQIDSATTSVVVQIN